MSASEQSGKVQLQAEQLQMHAANLPLAVAGSVLAAVVLAAVLTGHVGSQAAYGWMIGMSVLFSGLAWFGLRHRRVNPAAAASGPWLQGFRFSVAVHGTAWGIAGLALYPRDDVVRQSFLALVIIGVAASGASMVALDFAAALLFVVPALAPLGLRTLADADTLHLAMGGLMWAYLGFLVMNSRLAHRRQLEVIELRAVDAARVRALRLSEDLLERTGELARVGGWELDRSTRALRLTPQAYGVLGLAPASVPTPEAMLDCFSPAARAMLEQAVRNAFDAALPFSLELPCVADAVRPQWVCCIGFPDVEGGRVVRLRGAVQDISERKASEVALLAAKDAAEQASRAKSAFLANMSHEIRTPMNGMLGMVELLNQMPMSDEQKAYVATMRHSGRSLLSLLNDILDLSKIESGKLELEHRRFDLRRTLRACTDLMGPMASHKGLTLSCDCADELPLVVLGDPMRLQQVLNNIVGNAIKFTSTGEVAVSVVPEPALGAAGIRVCVADTGPGIEPASADSLFGAFVQGDNSTARKHGGSGLGLAIARSIVEAMGGTLTVESAVGQGTRFCFTARLGPSSTKLERADGIEAGLFQPLEGPGGIVPTGRRILLAEDNPVNQLYAQAVLENLGHAVDVAVDGVQAVEMALGDDAYDVILMDCHMPLVDGFEATRRIRAAEARLGRPRRSIVAVTASAMAEDRERCRDCGMDDVLFKPFSIEEMRELLLRTVGRQE